MIPGWVQVGCVSIIGRDIDTVTTEGASIRLLGVQSHRRMHAELRTCMFLLSFFSLNALIILQPWEFVLRAGDFCG